MQDFFILKKNKNIFIRLGSFRFLHKKKINKITTLLLKNNDTLYDKGIWELLDK